MTSADLETVDGCCCDRFSVHHTHTEDQSTSTWIKDWDWLGCMLFLLRLSFLVLLTRLPLHTSLFFFVEPPVLAQRMFRKTVQTAVKSFQRNQFPQQGRAIHRLRELSMYQGRYNSNSNDQSKFAGLAAITAACFTTMSLAAQPAHAEAVTDGEDKFSHTKLFPAIKPYSKGMLRVSDIHSIAYSEYGNPNGKPVIFVHGGPGGGTDPYMARYFDPKAYRIILVDQRGCGDSTPFADLRENTTYDSVRDFEKLRKHLNIEKWQVFGGSWGSTLGLAYAIEHPEVVTELVLRGIFLLRKKEIDWFYEGKGANFIFPKEWADYERIIPLEERNNFVAAYGRRLRGEMGEEAMHEAARAWSIWEGRTSKLVQDPETSVAAKFGDDHFSLAFARIENHYFTNHGFFPRDGFLLESQNLDKIRHIPTFIVQGRYDVVCPAISAYDLHQALPSSEIVFTLTGHSAAETEIIEHLVNATERFKNRV